MKENVAPKIIQAFPNHEMDYDKYEGLFSSIVYIADTLVRKGVDYKNIREEELHTNYGSTRNLLMEVVYLFFCGWGETLSNVVMELEYNKYYFKPETTLEEMNELLLAKVLMGLFLKNDFESVYHVISFLCSGSVYQRVLETYPLAELKQMKERE